MRRRVRPLTSAATAYAVLQLNGAACEIASDIVAGFSESLPSLPSISFRRRESLAQALVQAYQRGPEDDAIQPEL